LEESLQLAGNNRSLVRRVFFSTSAAIILVAATIGVLYALTSMRFVRADLDAVNLEVASQVASSVDLMLTRVQDFGRQIVHDDRVERFITGSPTDGVAYYSSLFQAHRLATNVVGQTSVGIHSVYLISIPKRRVYSSNSTSFAMQEYDDPELLDTLLGRSVERLWSPTQVISRAYIDPGPQREELIAFVQGYPMLTFRKQGFVQVNIHEQVLLDVAASGEAQAAPNFVILDGDGRVVTRRTENAAYASLDSLPLEVLLPATEQRAMARLDVAGVPSVAFSVRSTANDWTYVSLGDARLYNAGFVSYQRLLALFCILAASAALPFAYLQSRGALRPLSTLMASVHDDHYLPPGARREDAGVNELDELSLVFSSLSGRIDELLDEMEHDRKAWWLRNLLIDGSFARLFSREHDHNASAFPYDRFKTVVFSSGSLDRPFGEPELAAVRDALFELGVADSVTEGVPIAGGSFCVILNAANSVDRDELVAKVRSRLIPGEGFLVAAGAEVDSLGRLSESYADARRLLSLFAFRSDVSIVSYATARERQLNDGYELHCMIDRLGSSLQSGDQAAVDSDLDRIFDTIASGFISLDTVHHVVRDLCYRVIRFLRDRNMGHGAIHADIAGFLGYEADIKSLQVLQDFVKRFYRRAVASIREQGSHSAVRREIVEAAISFVDDHLGNTQLSLQLVSDDVGVSLSNLSRLFKAETGENFSTYVTARRIDLARSLFDEDPELFVKDVSEIVGYDNTHSFTRAFRRHLGVSPTIYRERAKRIVRSNS